MALNGLLGKEWEELKYEQINISLGDISNWFYTGGIVAHKVVIVLIKQHYMKTYWGSLGSAIHTFAGWILEGVNVQLQEKADLPT